MGYPKPGPGKVYRKAQRHGPRPAKFPALPKSAITPKFFDPDLNQWWRWLQTSSQRQDERARNKPLAGFNPSYGAIDYLFGDMGASDQSATDDQGDGGGWLNTVVDVLSRPLYGTAEAVNQFGEELKDLTDNGFNANELNDLVSGPLEGAWQGVSGQKHTTFADVLRNPEVSPVVRYGLFPGMPFTAVPVVGADILAGDKFNPGSAQWYRNNDKVAASQGLFLDIFGDPSTYVGLGPVGKIGTGARIFKDAASVETAVGRISSKINDLSKAGRLSRNEADNLFRKLTSEKFRFGHQKPKNAQAFEGRAIKDISKIVEEKKALTQDNVFIDTLQNMSKVDRTLLKDRKGRFVSVWGTAETVAKKAGDQTAEMVEKQMLDDWRLIVNADYKKTLGLGTRNYRIPILPSVAVEKLGKLAELRPLQAAADISQRYLRNSYKILEDVYRVKVEAVQLGNSRTYMALRQIDKVFSQLDRDGRRASWALGLKREPSNMRVTLDNGEVVDAADQFSKHVDFLSHRVNGLMGELPFTPEELNHSLPPGMPKIFSKKSQKDIGEEMGLFNRETGKFKKGRKRDVEAAWADQDWFRESLIDAMENPEIKGMVDGGHSLATAQAAVEHASARREMFENMADAFGFNKDIKKADGIQKHLLGDLEKRGWRETKGIPELKGYLFNDEVATGIEKIVKLMNDQREWGRFVKFLNRITNPLKWWYTQPNPGYHIRNILGDAFINWIDGAINPADYRAAMRLLGYRFRGMEKFEQSGMNQIPMLQMLGDPLENALNVTNKPILRNSAALRDARGNVKKYITDSELYAGIMKHGIRQNLARTQFGELDNEISTWGTAFTDAVRPVTTTVRRMSEWREDYMRIAHFTHLVRTNPSKARTLDEAMQFAADRVRMTHFDYTDFTKFEQQYASNVIPFYKWTRKAVPLMARFMFEHPGKVIIPEKITKNLSGFFGYWPGEDRALPGLDGEFVPDWLVEGGYAPVDLPGMDNPMFLRYPSPFSDVLAFQGNDISTGPQGLFDTFMNQATPYARIPYELMNNRRVMFAGEDVPIYGEGGTGLGEYSLNQLPVPLMRQLMSAQEGQHGPLLSEFGGLYARELTKEDQKNEILSRIFDQDLPSYKNAYYRKILKQNFGVDLSG